MRIRYTALGLAALLALIVPGTASAYGALATVPNFAPAVGGGAGGMLAANGSSWLNGASARSAVVQTAGKAITMPATMRIAANAGSIVATAARLNPVGIGVSVAAWLLLSGIDYNENTGTYEKPGPERDGFQYQVGGNGWKFGREAAVLSVATPNCLGGGGQVASVYWMYPSNPTPGQETIGYFRCSYGGVVGAEKQAGTIGVKSGKVPGPIEPIPQELQPQVFEKHAQDFPLHTQNVYADSVLNEFPDPLPVQSPELDPVEQPQGQPYPGVDPAGPWKLDVLKISNLPNTPNPLDVDVVLGTVNADNPGTPEDESAGESEPTPYEDPCKARPDTAGCVPLGDLPMEDLPTQEIPVTYTPTSGWQDSAACPAPINVPTHAGNLQFSFQMFCTTADYARPIVLAIAYIAAAFAFVGMARRGD